MSKQVDLINFPRFVVFLLFWQKNATKNKTSKLGKK
jgi:hypothetical protein